MPLLNDSPQANEQLSASQPLIRANFQSLNPCVGGIFNLQAVGGLGTAATELTLYNKNDGAGVPQLYLRRQGIVVGGAEASITAFGNTIAAPNNDGFTMLSSGVCMKWGRRFIAAGTANVAVTYDATYLFLDIYTRTVSFDIQAAGNFVSPAGTFSGANSITTVTCSDGPNNMTQITLRKPTTWSGWVNYIAIGRIV